MKYFLANLIGLLLASDTLSQQAEPLADIASSIVAQNCTVVNDDNTMKIDTTDQGAIIDFNIFQRADLPKVNGPAEVQFLMRTQVTGELGEYLVYWISDEHSDWTRFERIPFQPDGKWHDYRLPLADSGQIRNLRFTFGNQAHSLELSDVKLIQVASHLPPKLQKQSAELTTSVSITSSRFTVQIFCADNYYTIRDKQTGRMWKSEPVSKWLKLCSVSQQDERTLQIEMYDLFAKELVVAQVALVEDNAVQFSLDMANSDAPINGTSHYPPRFSSDISDGHFVFCDRSCGVLLDQEDKTYAHWPLRVYGNTHCLDMPWVGLFDDQQGDGMMLLVETPVDAEVAFVPHSDGRHWPEVRWLPSMDTFRYGRRASLRFTDKDRYVGLAQIYRDFLKSEGRFRTLKQKEAEKPNVARLRGAPSLWGGRYPTKFIRQMRPLGITRGIVNTCKDPGLIAWLNDLGYLTGRYDSYTDILEGDTAFQRDNVERVSVRSRPGGSPKHGWKLRSGEHMYWRSSAFWQEAADSYVPDELARLPYTERFIDVAAAADLLEDFNPLATFDRRQDLANRRALFDRMNAYKLVLGTEHGNDWVADQVEYFEGTMSGPFWWSSWPAGYLERPKKEELSENYLKYGMGYANRIPLWELVYHDCAVTTWYWADTAGLLYEAAPELADRKDLFNILYGTPPLFWMNNTGYRIPEDQHRMLRSFHDTCPLHENVAFEQMISHEFLTEDRSVQRTRFGNGTELVVNFADEPHTFNSNTGEVILAPRGFYVQGPGFSQSRLWVNDAPQTVIAKSDYLTVDSAGKEFVSGVKCNGRVTLFKTEENKWNCFLEPACDCELNLAEITGWSIARNMRVCLMDDLGETLQTICSSNEHGIVHIQSTEDTWRFAIVCDKLEVQKEKMTVAEKTTDDIGIDSTN